MNFDLFKIDWEKLGKTQLDFEILENSEFDSWIFG